MEVERGFACMYLYWGLHRNLDYVLAGRVGDNGAINLLAIEGDALNTLLLAVRMDGDLVLGIAELTLYGVVGSCLGQTWVDADTIVVGLDTEDEL